jgi:hypothetical protein
MQYEISLPQNYTLLNPKNNVVSIFEIFQRIALKNKEARLISFLQLCDPAVRKNCSRGNVTPHL